MKTDLAQIEPVREECDDCSYSSESHSNALLPRTEKVLCMSCLLDKDLDEEDRKQLKRAIKMDIIEGEIEDHYSGYSSSGAFGDYRIEFKIKRNAKVRKQVKVDQFKDVGNYTELRGSGKIILEIPGYGDTKFQTEELKNSINEKRREQAVEEHNRRK
jgi:hypothetical protein